MVDYVEFPTDLLRKVVLRPKKPPPPPLRVPFPPGADWGACGLYTWSDDVIYDAGLYSPQSFGMWMLTISEEGDLIWVHMPYEHADPGEFVGNVEWFVTPYLWYLPTKFIVTATTVPYEGFVTTMNVAFKLRIWNNPDVLSFHPCHVAPDQELDGGPSFDTISTEILPDALFTVCGTHSCNGPSGVVFIEVQAVCPDENTQGQPIQPKGFPQTDPRWAIIRIGPPQAGSIFLP